MTTQINKFIDKQESLTDSQKEAFKLNRLALLIFNITLGTKYITFDALTNFFNLETIKLEKNMVRVWEIFTSFSSTKNATNIMLAIAEGRALTDDIFDQQSKITPKAGKQKALNFNAFIESLEPKQLETLIKNVDAWYNNSGLENSASFFELAYINKEGAMKPGDYVRFTERTRNFYGRVLGTANDGWVSVVGVDGYLTLLADQNPEVVKEEVISKEQLKMINETFKKFDESGQDANQKALENMIKRADIQEEKERKEAEKLAKAEAKAKKEEKAKEKALKELESMKLTTKEDIREASKTLRAAKLDKKQTADFKQKIDEAREKLKKGAQATEKAEATPEAKEEKETPKASKGKGWQKSQKNAPKS